MKLRLPRRRLWRCAIYVISLLLVLTAIDLTLVETRRTIHPGYETTRIDGPLQADGSIDYLMALDNRFSQGITPENNAVPLLLRALGRKMLAKNQPPDGITDRLGMQHLPEHGDYLIEYDGYCLAHSSQGEPNPFASDAPTPIPWPLIVKPITAQWIKENEKPLALITEASKRPRFFIPFYGGYRPETMTELYLPHVAPLRDVCRPFLTRALIRLEAGDAAGFREDVLTVHRLARLLGQASTMVERVVANGWMEIPACQVERLAAANGKLTAEQARILAAELEAMRDLPPIMDCIDVLERFAMLDLLQSAARMGPARAGRLFSEVMGDRAGFSGPIYRFIPMPYEECMRRFNHFYDGAFAATRQPSYSKCLAAMRLWDRETSKIRAKNRVALMLTADWPVMFFMPSLFRPYTLEYRARRENRLTQVALALAAFKGDHHAYPATLAELSPGYLRAIPIDLFSEKPLIYSPTAKGYKLYSVSSNIVDEGGSSTKPADDIEVNVP